jgi:hypothetical protein
MKLFLKSLALLATTTCISQAEGFSSQEPRRAFLSKVQNVVAPALIATIAGTNPSIANAAATKDLVADLVSSKEKLAPIPDLLQKEEWDKVRTILKTPPVNQLWNLGESQNPLVKIADNLGEIELLDLKDELAISLQMCDQLTYANAFVYFQPGNGKVNIKQPTDLANKAMAQIGDAISLAGGN